MGVINSDRLLAAVDHVLSAGARRVCIERLESRQFLTAAPAGIVPWMVPPLFATSQPLTSVPPAEPGRPIVASPVPPQGNTPSADTGTSFMSKSSGPRLLPLESDPPTSGGQAQLGVSPTVTTVIPAAGSTGVLLDSFVRASVSVPNGAGIDPATVIAANVFLTGPGGPVAASVNTSGGGDVLVLSPEFNLQPNTTYTFNVTSGVKDLTGEAFTPFTSTFTTGTQVGVTSGFRFSKTGQAAAPVKKYTGVTFGPDGKLYATALTGEIYRFNVAANGTLTLENTNTTFSSQGRYVVGLVFDPASTPTNPIAWVTHTHGTLSGGADWSSAISKLSGANLATRQDAIVGLPRSKKDHLTNQLAFGPDGALYFSQGSNTAMGGPDSAWGFRLERLLNAATLRLNVAGINQRLADGLGALNVRTEGPTSSGGSADDVAGISAPWSGVPYDPFAAGALLTIYASGVRNAYDLVWAQSSGQWNLYTATNGSAPGGSVPATPAPGTGPYLPRVDAPQSGGYVPPATAVAAMTNLSYPEPDFLYRVRGPKANGTPIGGVPYFGHPNATRHEYILNGANPTAGTDRNQVTNYPVGTQPDRNYRADDAFAFGDAPGFDSPSADGMIQYKGTAFGGALTGQLLIIAYSSNKEVYSARIGADGSIVPVSSTTNITRAALTDVATGQSMRFTGAVDLVEHPTNGTLYVADHDGQGIFLLAPVDPNIEADRSRLIFSDATATPASAPQQITIRNSGSTNLVINSVTLGGTDAANFAITAAPAPGTSVAPGGSVNVSVAFNAAGATAQSIRTATLNVASNDADAATLGVFLRGLALGGYQGNNEPPLKTILNLYDTPVNVGGTALALPYNLNGSTPVLLGEEVLLQRLVKATPGPVTVQPIATFGPDASPDYTWGIYTPGSAAATTPVYTAETPAGNPAGGGGQTTSPVPTALAGGTVVPTADGPASVQFDPGSAAFGIYSFFTGVDPDLTAYSEDGLNTPLSAGRNRRIRFWPLKNPDGSVVPNAYIGGIEEASNNDLQDVVFIVRNVTAAGVDTTAPRVADLAVRGSGWASQQGASIPGGASQALALPWTNLNQVRIRFSEDVVASAASLSVNAAVGSYAVTAYSYEPATFTGVWTLNNIPANDKLRVRLAGVTDLAGNALDGEWTDNTTSYPSGNGSAGGAFAMTLNVLAGDVNGDGFVLGNDGNAVRARLASEAGTGNYLLQADINGDGFVLGNDGNAVRARLASILTPAPLAPLALSAQAPTATQVTLNWIDDSANEDGFRIERSTAGGAFVEIATVGANITTYNDSGRTASTNYAYRMRAYNVENSGYSNTATVTTPASAPFTVTSEAETATISSPGGGTIVDSLHAGASGNAYVDYGTAPGDYVQWSINVPAAGSYRLEFRYANNGGSNRPLALTVNGVSITTSLAFAATSAWTTWELSSRDVTLQAGTNTIRLAIPSGASSGPNVDWLRVSQL